MNNVSYKVNLRKKISEKKDSVQVDIEIIITNSTFSDRLISLDSLLYFNQRSILSRLITRKSYTFNFDDIVSISRKSNTSPDRTFSYLELFHGITVEFIEDYNKADTFMVEIQKFLSKHLEQEHLSYLRRRANLELEIDSVK